MRINLYLSTKQLISLPILFLLTACHKPTIDVYDEPYYFTYPASQIGHIIDVMQNEEDIEYQGFEVLNECNVLIGTKLNYETKYNEVEGAFPIEVSFGTMNATYDAYLELPFYGPNEIFKRAYIAAKKEFPGSTIKYHALEEFTYDAFSSEEYRVETIVETLSVESKLVKRITNLYQHTSVSYIPAIYFLNFDEIQISFCLETNRRTYELVTSAPIKYIYNQITDTLYFEPVLDYQIKNSNELN